MANLVGERRNQLHGLRYNRRIVGYGHCTTLGSGEGPRGLSRRILKNLKRSEDRVDRMFLCLETELRSIDLEIFCHLGEVVQRRSVPLFLRGREKRSSRQDQRTFAQRVGAAEMPEEPTPALKPPLLIVGVQRGACAPEHSSPQNRKYLWAIGSTVAGSQVNSSPSARTS